MRLILFSMIFLASTFMGCGGDNHGSDNVSMPVKSLAEIADDMEKVTIDSWDAVVGEQDSLGKIAFDLKIALPKPIGEFASRIILLQKELIILLHRDMDIENRENIINKTLIDANRLNDEIDESIFLTTENEIVNLKRLTWLSKSTKETQDQAENIKILFTVNRDEEDEPLIDRRKEIARRNEELQLKLEVASGTRLLKERLEE